MAITLNKESKLSIEKVTGISYDDILSMDIEELNKRIEQKIGRKLEFKQITDKRLIGRGSVYLFLNRFLNFNFKKMDKFIDSLTPLK